MTGPITKAHRAQLIYRAMLSAAPAPEGGAVDGWRPIDSAPQDGTKIDLWGNWPEHDRWTRTPDAVWDEERCDWKVNGFYAGQYAHPPRFTHWRAISGPAALATREEAPAPCKSCNGSGMDAGSRFNRCPDCREEAPAEAGEYAEVAAFVEAMSAKATDEVRVLDIVVPVKAIRSLLRAQPQAREDVQPVAWTEDMERERREADYERGFQHGKEAVRDYTHPAPDALRVAVEALTEIRDGMLAARRDISVDDWIEKADQALAILRAKQKGGAA